MFYLVWRFRAKPARLEQFLIHYAAEGEWSKLFAQSPEYRGTQLLRHLSDPRTFLIIDQWSSAAAYARFKRQFAAEYDALDRRCEAFTEQETEIGRFNDENA